MILRLRYSVLGGHVHCRLFTAKAENQTFAKCGDLVFAIEEWDAVCERLWEAMAVLPDEGDEEHLTSAS